MAFFVASFLWLLFFGGAKKSKESGTLLHRIAIVIQASYPPLFQLGDPGTDPGITSMRVDVHEQCGAFREISQ